MGPVSARHLTGKRRAFLVAVVLVAMASLDLSRRPGDQLSTRTALGLIHVYQGTLSRVYGRMGLRCRFTPSCSHYGEACIQRFGVVRGGWLAVKRVLRCGPWTPLGTTDPPPDL